MSEKRDLVGLLYFVAGRALVGADDLVGLGLGHLAGMGVSGRGTQRGPDGGSGYVFTVRERGEGFWARWKGYVAAEVVPGMYPDRQCWVNTGDGIWVGWYTDARKPGPEDLRRLGDLRGRAVQLLDGNVWDIPTRDDLPAVFGFDASGKFAVQSAPESAEAVAAMDRIVQWQRSGEARAFDLVAGDLACLMGMVYRVSLREVLALGLLGPGNLTEVSLVAMCAADLRAIFAEVAEAQKKSGDADMPG